MTSCESYICDTSSSVSGELSLESKLTAYSAREATLQKESDVTDPATAKARRSYESKTHGPNTTGSEHRVGKMTIEGWRASACLSSFYELARSVQGGLQSTL
jgi:hypothetical protein